MFAPMVYMRIQQLLCTLLLTTVAAVNPAVTSAQTEIWDTYISRFNEKPATVLLDMALILGAPDQRFPYLVITGPQAHNCGTSGIPGVQEIDNMEGILDATTNFLTGVTPKVLAGTVMYNCQRNNYYYVKDTMGVRNAIMRMYNRNYKDYKFSLSIKPDPQWTTYRTFLYPNEATQNWMDNNRVIAALLQKGDSLNKPRTITFAACFKSDSARTSFSKYVTDNGYTVSNTHTTKQPDVLQCLLFTKYSPILVDSINVTTATLRNEVTKHSGLYNGWDAPVKK